jgi:hypothetical protein
MKTYFGFKSTWSNKTFWFNPDSITSLTSYLVRSQQRKGLIGEDSTTSLTSYQPDRNNGKVWQVSSFNWFHYITRFAKIHWDLPRLTKPRFHYKFNIVPSQIATTERFERWGNFNWFHYKFNIVPSQIATTERFDRWAVSIDSIT